MAKVLYKFDVIHGAGKGEKSEINERNSLVQLRFTAEDADKFSINGNVLTFECKNYVVNPEQSTPDWKKFFECWLNGSLATIKVKEGFHLNLPEPVLL